MDRQNLLLFRGATCGVVLNRYPYNNGHLLIFPYRHVPDTADLTEVEQLELFRLLNAAKGVLKRLVKPDGFNIGVNLSRSAGACLEDHLHVHLVPRWNGDTNFMAVVGDTRVIPQALDAAWELLGGALSEAVAAGRT